MHKSALKLLSSSAAVLFTLAPVTAATLGEVLDQQAQVSGQVTAPGPATPEPAASPEPAGSVPAAAVSTAEKSGAVKKKETAELPPNFKIGSRFSRGLQKYTGINFITETVANTCAGAVIHHKVGGKVKVRVKTYSLTDLMAGKLRSVNVDIKDPSLKGVDLGQVSLASQNPIWFGKRGLKTPTTLKVRASLSQKQIARALNSPEVASQLQGLKLDMPGIGEQQLQVLNPKVQIIDDLLTLEALLVTKGGALSSGLPLRISARPRLVEGARVVLDDLKVEGPDIVEPEKFAKFAQALLNPLVDFSRYDRKDHAFRLACLKVAGASAGAPQEGCVSGEGTLLLVPRAQVPGNVQVAGRKQITR